MHRFLRPLALLALCALAGCNTTGASTYSTDQTVTSSTDSAAIDSLGIDSFGNPVAQNPLTLPWSNQASLKGDPSNRLLQLGKESFRDANYGLSEKYFRKAVEIRPDNATAWAGLAASYDELGRFDLADRAYDQLVKLNGNDARTLNNRGYSYLLRGDYKRARQMLERAQAIDPGLEEIQGNLTLLDKIRSS